MSLLLRCMPLLLEDGAIEQEHHLGLAPRKGKPTHLTELAVARWEVAEDMQLPR